MPSWSGLFDNVKQGGYSPLSNRVGANYGDRISLITANKNYGGGAFRQVLRALNGAAAGATATFTFRRVQALVTRDSPSNGGLVDIQVVTPINRATTAADQALLDASFARATKPATYPVDPSGNGGGNKRGY